MRTKRSLVAFLAALAVATTSGIAYASLAQEEPSEGEYEHTLVVLPWEDRTFSLLVTGNAAAEPGEAGTLSDTGTRKPVTNVQVVETSRCEGEPRDTGLTSGQNCLRVDSFPSATSAVGTLNLDVDTLALTVHAHHPYWMAYVVAFAATIAGVIILWLATTLLPRLRDRERLQSAISAAVDAGIVDAEAWAKSRSLGLSATERATTLNQAAAAITEAAPLNALKNTIAALDSHTDVITAQAPDLAAARQLGTNGQWSMADIYDNGDVQHPADRWSAAVRGIENPASVLNGLLNHLDGADPDAEEAKAGRRKVSALIGQIHQLELTTLRSSGWDKLPNITAAAWDLHADYTGLEADEKPIGDLTPAAAAPSLSAMPGRTTRAQALGWIVASAIIAITALILWSTQATDDNNFGLMTDYLGLAGSAVAAGLGLGAVTKLADKVLS